VLRRSAGASGGKSGALNQVLPLTRGEILAVFDADAQVSQTYWQVLPLFEREAVGAVQVRAIANGGENFWTQGQVAEMALDSYFQQQRDCPWWHWRTARQRSVARRTALERCGGWNEETITDDLDLTLRLHLDQWDIEFLPSRGRRRCDSALALWHQRNRWAEGISALFGLLAVNCP